MLIRKKVGHKMNAKKTISYTWFVTGSLALVFLFSGCGTSDEDAYGQEISDRTATKVEAILTEPENYEGKTVTVKGKIINECPSGCWFEVKENSGIIYVDLNPSGFAIPQKVGNKVIVEGKVQLRGSQPMLAGTGVEIK